MPEANGLPTIGELLTAYRSLSRAVDRAEAVPAGHDAERRLADQYAAVRWDRFRALWEQADPATQLATQVLLEMSDE